MKYIFTITSILLCSAMLYSQTEITEIQPINGSTTTLRAPNGTSAHTTMRGHLIVLASELGNVPSGVTITKLGFTYSAGTDALAEGNMKFYLENSADVVNNKSNDWATAISTMTNVSDGNFTLPISAGPADADMTLSTPFVYNGGGLYVGYDYLATTTSAVAATNLADNTLPGGVKMVASTSTTPSPTLTGTSSFRPAIRITFLNPNTNEVQVISLNVPNAKLSLLSGTSQTMEALVLNASQGALTNIPVTLSITGTNTFTSTQNIANLAPGASSVVTFTAVPQAISGMDTIRVTVPNDDNNNNNLIERLSHVTCDTLGACSPGAPVGSVGFNTGSGILANRYKVNSTAPIVAKKVAFYVANNAASPGNIIKGVLCDSAGVIVDSTFIFAIPATSLGTKVELSFINGNIDVSNKDFYFGIRQSANTTTGYFPFGTQPNDNVPPNRFYSLPVYGEDTTSYTTLGMFMIEAVLAGRQILTSDAPGGSVCENTPVNFSTTGGYSNYNFYVDNTSTQTGAGNTFTHTTVGTQAYKVESTYNGCTIVSNTITVTSAPEIQNTVNATICDGDSYQVGSNTYTADGTYIDTLSSQAGCDSIVTLNLTVQMIDTSSQQAGPLLTANQTGATYQWYDCGNSQPIAGATSSTYLATTSGSYACIVTIGNCSDTTACRIVDFTGLGELDLLKSSVISPNPTNGPILIGWQKVQVENIVVRDVKGKVLFETETKVGNMSAEIDLSLYEAGSYFIELQSAKAKFTHLVIKK